MWLMYDEENYFYGIIQSRDIEALKNDYIFVKIPERIEEEWVAVNEKEEGYYKYYFPKTEMIVFGERIDGKED